MKTKRSGMHNMHADFQVEISEEKVRICIHG